MKLFYTDFIKEFFLQNLDEFIRVGGDKIPTFIQNNYFRIKPIHKNPTELKIFELKIFVKKEYRIAFVQNMDEVIICFASNKIIKDEFEKEFIKFINKNKNFLSSKRSFN